MTTFIAQCLYRPSLVQIFALRTCFLTGMNNYLFSREHEDRTPVLRDHPVFSCNMRATL